MQTSTSDITLADLANEPIWLAWQNETRTNKQGKQTTTKVPYAADGSDRPGSSTDPKTWGTKREAGLAASKLSMSDFSQSGVGIVLGTTVGDGLRLAGTDLDTCIGNDDIEQWAADIIHRLNSYSERSPSKTGAHVLFLYRDSDRVKLQPFLNGKDGQKFALKSDTNHPPSIELYLAGRYFTVTDEILISETLRVVDAEDLLWLLQKAGPQFVGEKEAIDEVPEATEANKNKSSSGADKASVFEPLAGSVQQHVVTAILYRDDEHVREIVGQAENGLFDDYYALMVVRGLEYWAKYKRPMGIHVDTEFADILNNKKKPAPQHLINTFYEMARDAGKVDTKYLRDTYVNFVRYQTGRQDLFKAGELLTQHNIDGFREAIEEAPSRSELIGHAGLQIVRASDVIIEPIPWLWPGQIPREAITLIGGMPDLGKSTLVTSLLASVTAMKPWPDGTTPSEPGDVLIFSAEDKPKNTIVPRLMAMGADLTRVEFVNGMVTVKGERKSFSLTDDLAKLEEELKKRPATGVVVIDPLMFYMGGKINAWVETQVRPTLYRLQELAEDYNLTILALMHFKKGTENNAIYQISNSIAFTAAARAVFTAIKEKNSDRRLLMPAKSNWSKGDHGFAYRIEETMVHSEKASGPVQTTMVIWEGRVEGTADDMLLEKKEKKYAIVKNWLAKRLEDGPVDVHTLKKEAAAFGDWFSWSTVERAGDEIAQKNRKGFAKGGMWELK